MPEAAASKPAPSDKVNVEIKSVAGGGVPQPKKAKYRLMRSHTFGAVRQQRRVPCSFLQLLCVAPVMGQYHTKSHSTPLLIDAGCQIASGKGIQDRAWQGTVCVRAASVCSQWTSDDGRVIRQFQHWYQFSALLWRSRGVRVTSALATTHSLHIIHADLEQIPTRCT